MSQDDNPLPILDDIRQVFILTLGRSSFFVDLEGQMDKKIPGNILWSGPPNIMMLATPFILAYIQQKRLIEVKHLFAPDIVS
jgi:hypothetical protein